MTDQNELKICPLMFDIQTDRNSEDQYITRSKCIKEKCIWYINTPEGYQQCAITIIAENSND